MKIWKTVFKTAQWILLGVLMSVLLISVSLAVKKYVFKEAMPKLFGYSYAIVTSGSMEPEIGIDDLIIIKEKDSYAVGDIITFAKSNYFVTHRIKEITSEGCVTKGDANNKNDDPIKKEDIQGKVIKVIPKVGLIYSKLMSPIGIASLTASLIIIFAAPIIIKSYKEEKGKKAYEKNKKAA